MNSNRKRELTLHPLFRPSNYYSIENDTKEFFLPFSDPVNPDFMFLQLQQIPFLSEEAKVLENSETVERSIKLLDLTHSKDTFKFGICYVKNDQTTEEEILSNSGFGSHSYQKVCFLFLFCCFFIHFSLVFTLYG